MSPDRLLIRADAVEIILIYGQCEGGFFIFSDCGKNPGACVLRQLVTLLDTCEA